MYASESLAEEALVAAWVTFEYSSGSGPIGVYRCEDCGNYHLTSKGTISKKLQEHLAGGNIKKMKEANDWIEKIKRRNKHW
ncbi:hypothetical protein [Chryseolinea sp. H1M3-3]|uniref:hypothetical protein n=1 Tax=Chryseolinea sp. H1M3-3 TaxID=3034144 RepID=UPI0023EAD51A|nr:hypothetical protein [Chryseolinea sp. H1M3-3]